MALYDESIESLGDPLDQIAEQVKSSNSDLPTELFTDERSSSDGIALKTDLIHKEHVLVSVLASENQAIKELFGSDFDLYGEFLNQFRRHKVSLDRKSREEFSGVLKGGISNKDLEVASNMKNLLESRK